MDPLKMYFLLEMGIFHCCVSLPEGSSQRGIPWKFLWEVGLMHIYNYVFINKYSKHICIYDDIYIYYINEIYVYMMIHIYIWLINIDDISSYIQHGGPRLLQIISFQHDVCPRFPGGFGVILATPRHASLHSSPKIARQRGWKKTLKSWHKKTRRTSLPMMDDVAWCWLMCFFNPNFKTATWHTHTHKMWFCEVKFNLVILFSKIYPDPQVCRWFLHWFSVLRFLDNFPTWDTVLRLVKSWVWDGPEMRKWMVRPR